MPEDHELTESVLRLASQWKLQRTSAFRQLQALSHMTQQLVGRRVTDFTVPDLQVRPVRPGEVRVLRQGTQALLVDTAAKTVTPALPAGLEAADVPLLVVSLDQGSVGAAGMAFLEYEMGLLVHTSYDKFHRLIRDVKLALKYAAGSSCERSPRTVRSCPGTGKTLRASWACQRRQTQTGSLCGPTFPG